MRSPQISTWLPIGVKRSVLLTTYHDAAADRREIVHGDLLGAELAKQDVRVDEDLHVHVHVRMYASK